MSLVNISKFLAKAIPAAVKKKEGEEREAEGPEREERRMERKRGRAGGMARERREGEGGTSILPSSATGDSYCLLLLVLLDLLRLLLGLLLLQRSTGSTTVCTDTASCMS